MFALIVRSYIVVLCAIGEAMQVKLVVVGGNHSGQEVPVPGPRFFVGRAEDCHLRPRSDLVSRHHAVILVEEGFVAVRDFGSKNGTFVNGEKIKTERELKTGDHLRFGPLEFEVELAVDVGGKKKPKVHSVEEAASRTVETASEGDLDIFNLLGDEGGGSDGTLAADTQPFSTTSTTTGDVGDAAAEEDQPPKEEDQQQEPKKKQKEKPTKVVGRLKDIKKPMAGDSTSAADDVLRQFFSRR